MTTRPRRTGNGAHLRAPATPAGPDAAALAREWSRLDAGVPLMLLPVRIETRFVAGALLIRIDPDVLHHDMHIRVLRSDEKALATAFWADVAAAGNDAAARSAAWQSLAAALGPWRAAWVARAVKTGVAEGPDRGRPAARAAASGALAGTRMVRGQMRRARLEQQGACAVAPRLRHRRSALAGRERARRRRAGRAHAPRSAGALADRLRRGRGVRHGDPRRARHPA